MNDGQEMMYRSSKVSPTREFPSAAHMEGRKEGMQPMHVRDLMTQDHESTSPMVTSMGLRELLGPSVTTP